MRLDARSGWLALAVGVVAGWVAAAPPAWWTNRGVLTTNAPNDFAPATAGQLKHIASKAKAELDYSLNDGAGTAVAARVASFLNTNNYAAINLGQIKHVAQPFYERINVQGIVTGYPWTVATTTDDMNFAAANLGQLKTVFSFDFDVDGDGMSDWWEMQHWTNTMHSGGDDGDNDGLLDVEEHVNRTDPNHNDSDGDGIPDGWEADNDLNPTNAADAEQDADGDTLSNLTEYQIGTDPNAVNTVQSVGDGEVLLETRSVASKRSLPKEGVAGFLKQDTYYRDIRLQADVNWDALYCETVPTTADVGVVTLRVDSHFMTETNCASIWSASGQLSGSNTVTVSDANTAVLSKSIDYTWATNIGEWVSLSRALWQTAAVGPGELIACTTEMNMPVCTTTNGTGTPPTVLFDERGPTNSLEDSHAQWKWEGAYGPGCTGVVISNSIPHGSVGSIDVVLTTPITISTLIDEVRANVTNADYWANLDWSAGFVEPRWAHRCPDNALGCTNADLIAAFYQTSTDVAAKKGEYQLSVPNSISGVVYRAVVLKQRMSDGQILGVNTFCTNSTGGNVYLTPTNGVPVHPPDSVDCIRIILLKVDILARAGKINYGFEPQEIVRDDDPYPWASVDKDDSSDVPKLVIDPGVDASLVEIVIASGGSAADIAPKTFTASSTDLTITGQGTAGNALVEARIGNSGPCCNKLNIMALPQRGPISVGIYRIFDSTSPGTGFPAGGASDADILATLNDVFAQAQIEFERDGSSGAYDIHYDTLKAPYTGTSWTSGSDGTFQFEERIAFANVTPWPWVADLKFFLIRQNGDTQFLNYPAPYTNALVRGFNIGGTPTSFIFTESTAGFLGLVVAHEGGHALTLATHDDDGGKHDVGPFPAGQDGLMRSGLPSGPVSAPVFPFPGSWLRHEDWKSANDKAGPP